MLLITIIEEEEETRKPCEQQKNTKPMQIVIMNKSPSNYKYTFSPLSHSYFLLSACTFDRDFSLFVTRVQVRVLTPPSPALGVKGK